MKRETLVTSPVDAFLNGDLGETIKKLASLKKTWQKGGYTDIHIEFEDEWGYYDEHNINVKLTGIKKVKNGRDLFKK